MIDWTKLQNGPELKHFIALARKGMNPAASGGERRAARMAAAIMENINGIDEEAFTGMLMFMAIRIRKPSAAEVLLETGNVKMQEEEPLQGGAQ